jgi:hypothetical protein
LRASLGPRGDLNKHKRIRLTMDGDGFAAAAQDLRQDQHRDGTAAIMVGRLFGTAAGNFGSRAGMNLADALRHGAPDARIRTEDFVGKRGCRHHKVSPFTCGDQTTRECKLGQFGG